MTRWSRRKARARATRDPAAPVPDADGGERDAADSAPGKTDADMPPIESLHADSDYAAFLAPEISEKLRRLALRKLFQLPQFNFRDGLDDYAEDYRNFAPLGDIITADMRHRMEREAAALKESLQTGAGGEHGNEKPMEKHTTGNRAGKSAGESADGPDSQTTPATATPKKHRPLKKVKT